MFGVPIVLPQLRQAFGVTTAQAGLLAGIPSFGLLLTLLLWGMVIDRVGERVTMALSLLLTAGALGVLWIVTGLWTAGAVLLLVGTVAGPVNAASGRLVLVWFAPHERGLAMGIRQSNGSRPARKRRGAGHRSIGGRPRSTSRRGHVSVRERGPCAPPSAREGSVTRGGPR